MALITPKNLYTGGAVALDSTPYTNFAIQMLQKQQAKQEAVDQYYQELSTKVDGKGIRPQEQAALLGLKNDYQQYYLQNRKAILNPSLDGGRAQAGMRSRAAQMNALVNDSAQLQQIQKSFADASLRNKDYVWDDEAMQAHQRFNQAKYIVDPTTGQMVQNPDWQNLDPTAIHSVKPLGSEDFNKYSKGRMERIARSDVSTVYQPTPDDPLTRTPITTKKYNPEGLASLVSEAQKDFQSDRSLRYTFSKTHPFQDWKAEHEGEFNKYNELYKSVTGRDIQDEAGLYAAMELQPAMVPVVEKGAPVENRTQALKQRIAGQKEMAAIQFGYQKQLEQTRQDNRKALVDYKKKAGTKDGESVLNHYINTLYDNATQTEAFTTDDKKNHFNGRTIILPNKLKEVFGRVETGADGKPALKAPTRFVLTSDKKYVVPIYAQGERSGTGKQAITTKAEDFIPIATFKAHLSTMWKGLKTADELNDDYDAPDVPATTSTEKENLDW